MTYFTYIFGRYYRWTFGQESDGIPWFMAETVGIGEFKMIQTWPSHFDIHMTLKHHIQTFLRFKHDVEYEEKETAKSGLAAVLGPISLFFALAAFPTSVPVKPSRVANWNHQLKACSLTSRLGMAKMGDCFENFGVYPQPKLQKKWGKGW